MDKTEGQQDKRFHLCWKLNFRTDETKSLKSLRKKGGSDMKSKHGVTGGLKSTHSPIPVIIRLNERDV